MATENDTQNAPSRRQMGIGPSLGSIYKEMDKPNYSRQDVENRILAHIRHNDGRTIVRAFQIRLVHHWNRTVGLRLLNFFIRLAPKKLSRDLTSLKHMIEGPRPTENQRRAQRDRRLLYETRGLEAQWLTFNHNVKVDVSSIVDSITSQLSNMFSFDDKYAFKSKIIRFVLFIFEMMSDSPYSSKMRMAAAFLIDYEWVHITMDEFAKALAQVTEGSVSSNGTPVPVVKVEMGEIEDASDLASVESPHVSLASSPEGDSVPLDGSTLGFIAREMQEDSDTSTASDDVEMLEAHASFLSPQVIKNILMGVSTVLCGMIALKPHKMSVSQERITELMKFARNIKNLESVWRLIDKIFGEAFTEILAHYGFVDPNIVIGKVNEEIIPWMEEVVNLPPEAEVKVIADYAFSNYIVSLFDRGDKFLKELQKFKIPLTVFQAFVLKYNAVRKLATLGAPHYFNDKMRKSPLVVHLHGKSGIGKSTVVNFLIQDIMQRYDSTFDINRGIYVRNDTQDHWDGYNNQPVVVFDDFLQARNVDQRTTQLMELIRMKNTTAYSLKMANLENKGNTRFTSQLVVINSNLDFPSHAVTIRESMESPEAVIRRVDVSAEVLLKGKYATEGKVDITKLDDEEKRFDEDIYGFMVKGKGIMNYAAFLAHCYTVWDRVKKADAQLIDGLPNWRGPVQEPQYLKESEFLDAQAAFDENYEDCADDFEAQAFFGNVRKTGQIVTEENDVDLYEQLMEYQYEVLKIKTPCETWPPEIQKAFIERYERDEKDFSFVARIKNQLEEWKVVFLRTNPWIKWGLGIVATIGTIAAVSYLFSLVRGEKCDMVNEASYSGDQITKKYVAKSVVSSKPLMKVEASYSGDQVTKKYVRKQDSIVSRRQLRSEMATQYVLPSKLTHRHHIHLERMEQEAAIDRSLYDGVLWKGPSSMECQGSSDPNASNIIANVIYNNIAKVTWSGCTINGLFLCDTILMIPRHFTVHFEKDSDLEIETCHHKYKYNLMDCKMEEGPERDIVLVQFPNDHGSYVDITKHFHTLADLASVNVTKGIVCTTRHLKDRLTMLLLMAENMDLVSKLRYVSTPLYGEKEIIQIPEAYKYKASTQKGDCGAPLIALNTGLQRKILGIHVAGTTDVGASNILCKEYILGLVGRFKDVIYPQTIELNSDTINMSAQACVVHDDKVEVHGSVSGNFTTRTPTETEIFPSPLHGLYEVKTAPAMLKPFDGINPMRMALESQFVPNVVFPRELVRMAEMDMTSQIIAMDSDYTPGLLTNDENLNGIDGDPWIRPINIRTSPGFPYIHLKRKERGKLPFVLGDVGAYEMGGFLEEQVVRRETLAQEGIIPFTLFVDVLKDERRTLEKVRTGKTRVFNTAPFDLTIMVRKYFGRFIAHIMSNHVYGECSVGINPHSDEWKLLYNHLESGGDHWIGGDYSKYDKTLSFQLIMSILNVINKWYGDENSLIRKVLFYTMFNAFHICGRVVYRMHQGNPSGIPLTVIINSLVNSMLSRISFLGISRELGYTHTLADFHQYVIIKNYGDDNLGRVNDFVSWYNMVSISEYLAKHGVIYTSPSKTKVDKLYLDRRDISYLKRGFVENKGGILAPLDMDSIKEMVMWIRKGPLSTREAVRMTYLSAVRECYHYGCEVFHEMQFEMIRAAYKVGIHLSPLDYFAIMTELSETFYRDPLLM